MNACEHIGIVPSNRYLRTERKNGFDLEFGGIWWMHQGSPQVVKLKVVPLNKKKDKEEEPCSRRCPASHLPSCDHGTLVLLLGNHSFSTLNHYALGETSTPYQGCVWPHHKPMRTYCTLKHTDSLEWRFMTHTWPITASEGQFSVFNLWIWMRKASRKRMECRNLGIESVQMKQSREEIEEWLQVISPELWPSHMCNNLREILILSIRDLEEKARERVVHGGQNSPSKK